MGNLVDICADPAELDIIIMQLFVIDHIKLLLDQKLPQELSLFFASTFSKKMQRLFPKVAVGNSPLLHMAFPYSKGV